MNLSAIESQKCDTNLFSILSKNPAEFYKCLKRDKSTTNTKIQTAFSIHILEKKDNFSLIFCMIFISSCKHYDTFSRLGGDKLINYPTLKSQTKIMVSCIVYVMYIAIHPHSTFLSLLKCQFLLLHIFNICIFIL